MAICPKCSSALQDGLIYCPFCGEEIKTFKNESSPKPNRRNRHNIPKIQPGTDIVPPIVTTVNNETKPIMKPLNSSNQPKEDSKKPVMENVKVEIKEEVKEEIKKEVKEKVTEKVKEEIKEELKEELKENINEDIKDDIKDDIKEDDSKNFLKQKKKRKDLEYELYHDELTGLMNRKAYERKIEVVNKAEFCIISVDANGLKKINDTKGHKYGDILIIEIANALKTAFGDNCYRTGGDEYIIVLEGIREEVVEEKIEIFRKALIQAEKRQDVQLDIRAAVGYAFGDGYHTVKEIAEEADKAMYQNKRALKEIYNPNHDGYYDDVKAEYEEVKAELDRDNIHKAVITVIITIAAILFSIFFL